MRVMIDIPKETYNKYKQVNWANMRPEYVDELECAIGHGTPLPKHYGRLIDADAYIESREECGWLDQITVDEFNEVTPTIIEASEKVTSDKSKSDDIPNDKAKPAWIFVKDKLPYDDEDVLVLFENGIAMAVAYHRIDETPYAEMRADMTGWYDENDEWMCHTNTILAWMPLPTPPKKEVEE